MTKEEYKKNLIRMFDSIRNEYKGDENCAGVNCGNNCPFYGKVCGMGQIKFHVYEAIEVVEKWAKEHPIMTNLEKFKEVFGTEPTTHTCVNPKATKCRDCKYFYGGRCKVRNRFWYAEYKPTKEGAGNEL